MKSLKHIFLTLLVISLVACQMPGEGDVNTEDVVSGNSGFLGEDILYTYVNPHGTTQCQGEIELGLTILGNIYLTVKNDGDGEQFVEYLTKDCNDNYSKIHNIKTAEKLFINLYNTELIDSVDYPTAIHIKKFGFNMEYDGPLLGQVKTVSLCTEMSDLDTFLSIQQTPTGRFSFREFLITDTKNLVLPPETYQSFLSTITVSPTSKLTLQEDSTGNIIEVRLDGTIEVLSENGLLLNYYPECYTDDLFWTTGGNDSDQVDKGGVIKKGGVGIGISL